jgi:hypothetical protein
MRFGMRPHLKCLGDGAGRATVVAAAWFARTFLVAALLLAGCSRTARENAARDSRNPAPAPPGRQASQAVPRLPCALLAEPARECPALHGEYGKSWRHVPEAGADQGVPFATITFHANGTWRDAAGVSGIWRVAPERRQIALLLDELGVVMRCPILELSDERLVLQFPRGPSWTIVSLVSAVQEHEPRSNP